MDDLDQVQKELVHKIFGDPESPPIPFVYDFEDFERCRVNIELKKLVSSKGLTLPIISAPEEDVYLVGPQKLRLSMKGQLLYCLPLNSNHNEPPQRLSDYIEVNDQSLKMQLAYQVYKSGLSLKDVIKLLLEGQPIPTIDYKEHQIMQSILAAKHRKDRSALV